MNNILNENFSRNCTGCGMCASICPSKAIKMEIDSEGFYSPQVDINLCNNCGICIKTCYKFDTEISLKKCKPIECFSAVNNDSRELENCSSGGVSIELMRECLNRGYYVVGVCYDYKNNIAVTKIAKSYNELEGFKGSKYFQSYTSKSFDEIVNDKSEQKYAFFGTPCQIYAFKRLSELRKNTSKYIFVDIFCHGCPSLNLWKKYLSYQRSKFGISEFEEIKFRSKTYNWHEFAFEFFADNKKYLSEKYNNPFYEIFFGMNAMNKACYDCVTRSSIEYTDIRIGDFWGSRFNKDIKGVSAVVINSEQGKELFYSVLKNFKVERVSFSEIIKAQSYGKLHICNEKKRERTLRLLSGDLNIKQIQKQYRKADSVKVIAKRILKNMAKHLPSKVYIRVKGLLYRD
ncbi:MAG: Coenzyme F420 hydrogenase/dehydrogenase, beta subunit C-terminal domain [Clostridia bacterium]|nr:Coenzyme F420 hydrogenase/dehydrogenase, beta subunit C-terminal domain [Clostridia bacterium]